MPDRRCKHIFAMLSDYLNAELPVKNCRELERHLKGCEPCIAYLKSLRNTVRSVPPISSARQDSSSLKESSGSFVLGSSVRFPCTCVIARRSMGASFW